MRAQFILKTKRGKQSAELKMETFTSKTTNLDKLIQDFKLWEEVTLELLNNNGQLTTELKLAQKQSYLHEEAAKASSQEAYQFRECIDKLHASLAQRCDIDDENGSLKKQLLAMNVSADQLEQEHKTQMSEALDDLHTLKATHKREIHEVQEKMKQQMQRQIDSLERSIREKNVEVKQLQNKNSDLERARHTEVVKLRLEYDAKLLKLQKQATRSQCPQSSSVNNEIFRKKLQHAKSESEKEISALKRKVAELERQLGSSSSSTHQLPPGSKKRRIY